MVSAVIEPTLAAVTNALGRDGVTALAAVLILTVFTALALWLVPSQRLRVTARQVFARALGQTRIAPPRSAAIAANSDVLALTDERLEQADTRYRAPRFFRVVNTWNAKGAFARKWASDDSFVCLQPAVIARDNLEVETVLYRIEIDNRIPIHAYILPRDASGDFEAKWGKDQLATDTLAIGFNKAALRQMPVDDSRPVQVSIRPAPSAPSEINLASLFLLIALPVGLASAILPAVFNSAFAVATDTRWLVSAGAMGLGLLLSALLLRIVRRRY